MSEWPMKEISDVCEVLNGGTPKSKVSEYWGEPHAWITPAEMGKRNSYFVNSTARCITDVGLKKCSAKLIPPSSVILSSRAPIGHIVINTVPMAFNQGCRGLVPSEELNHVFLAYYLSANVERLNSLGTGATFKELSSGKLKSFEIPLPPLAEQKRIVSILDEAFGAIAKAKENAARNLANARELFDSYLNRVFTEKGEGWEETTLGEVADFKNGLNFDKNSNGQTLPIVGVGDFQKNFYVPISSLKTATIDEKLADNYALEKNDILTVRSNGSKHLIGRCMLVPELQEVTSYSGFVIRIRYEQTKLNPRFLLYFMKSRRTVYLLTRDGGGANINNINQGKLSALPLSFPADKDEQVRLANNLDRISQEADSLMSCCKQKYATLDELKQSLLQKAFTGQLTSKSKELELVP